MRRNRTVFVTALLLVPVVAGGFLLQEPPARANQRLFDQVFSLISSRYVDSLQSKEVVARAARGLVNELHDPYTELFTPRESDDFARGTNGRYGGTGMLLGEDNDRVISVQRVFPNTPAEEAGVREGDHIASIADTSTADWGLTKVSERLRGSPGSHVVVTFNRPGVAVPIRLMFVRREVRVPAVPYAGVIEGIGYIPLQAFNENATDEVEEAVHKVIGQGARGLVLDLRENGGGIVEQALEVSSLFLNDEQTIVTVRSRGVADEVSTSPPPTNQMLWKFGFNLSSTKSASSPE